jgi:hypothetical protein
LSQLTDEEASISSSKSSSELDDVPSDIKKVSCIAHTSLVHRLTNLEQTWRAWVPRTRMVQAEEELH